MRFSTALVALAAPFLVKAAPIRRQVQEINLTVMKFADVLEQLETQFYAQGLQRFQAQDFVDAGFSNPNVPVEQITRIHEDEAAHSTFLQTAIRALGGEPITTCTFNFEPALKDVATMAATARVVEYVGVAAYMGGATLLTESRILSAAAGILTAEARHQTALNILSGQGTAIPSAFDFAFNPSEVLALAVPFIDPATPCDVGIPANPTLSITNTGPVGPGTLLTFQSAAINGSTDGLFCQMLLGDMEHSLPLPLSQCIVPNDINGPVAIWVTSDDQPLLNNVVDRASSQLVAGPTLAFIDTQPEALGQFAVSGGSGASGPVVQGQTTTSTTTISPEAASSIIAESGATPVPVPAGDASSAPAPAPPAPSGSAPAPPSGNASSTPASGPNQQTGASADGAITVNGWSTVPRT